MASVMLNWDLASICKEQYGGCIGGVHGRSTSGLFCSKILWVLEYSRLEDIIIN